MPRIIAPITLCLFLTFAASVCFAENPGAKNLSSYMEDVKADYRFHYSLKKLGHLGLSLGAGGILANTSADRRFREFVQDDVRSDSGDKFFDVFTFVGDAGHIQYAVPVYLGAMFLGRTQSNSSGYAKIHDWGWRSLRTLMLGAPQQFFFTHALGAMRPEEGDSNWDFFDDNNGVSGHTFYGAVPLITAATLTDNSFIKYTLYATSILPGLARINDDQHYLSQVVIGWLLAYMAADTVANTDSNGTPNRISMMPFVLPDGGGVIVAGQL